MPNSQRLEGLELLRLIGAPVPEWQIVRSRIDIDHLDLPDTRFGWTIRTCRTDGKRETGLFYLNLATPETIQTTLRERFEKSDQYEFYIVYPSWQFRFSCNVVLREEIYLIEGKFGSQKSLSVGQTGPDFALRIPFGIRSEMSVYSGHPDDQVLSSLGEILLWCKRIPMKAFYAEVALIHIPALMFYELFAL